MKRLIAAVIILVLIVTLSTTGITIINRCTKEVEKRITEIHNNPVTTNNYARDFVAFWESKREILAIFVNHNKLDDIGRVAARMASAEKTNNINDMLEAADEIVFIIKGLKEDEDLSWFTVL